MSLNNPTRLRLGMHGNFSGTDYQLVGRVVMGVVDEGETYYWNEFNLESRSGKKATLVYEATERGGEWRIFNEFEPECPLTAADAATKHPGDKLNLTGIDVRVTLRDSSRVYFIEGKAPEGLQVGDVAEYFNAEARGVMQVVSWTGDDVEYYNGVNLSPGVVNSAFNLPVATAGMSGMSGGFSALNGSDRFDSEGTYLSPLKALGWGAGVVWMVIATFGSRGSWHPTYQSAPLKKILAGPPPLSVGADGKLKDKHYHINGHAVVEINEVGFFGERHEYELTDDSGRTALLVCGGKPGDQRWTIYSELTPVLPPSARECAAKKLGDAVNVDGVAGPVREIFRSFVRESDGVTSGALLVGRVCFGYLAQSEYHSLLVRWDGAAVFYESGSGVLATDAKAAFAAPSGK